MGEGPAGKARRRGSPRGGEPTSAANPIRYPRFVNLQAPNAAPFWQAVATWLGEATRRPIAIEREGHWTAWRDALAEGRLELGTACGAYYAAWADERPPAVALVAA